MGETQNGPKPRMSGRVQALLIGSLALNLVVAGLVIGAIATHGGRPDMGGRADPLVRALAMEDRRAIGKAVKDAQGGGRKAFRAAQRAALEDVAAALRAEPFDAVALEAALSVKSANLRQTRAAAEAAMLTRFAAMSAAERLALADRLEAALARSERKFKPAD